MILIRKRPGSAPAGRSVTAAVSAVDEQAGLLTVPLVTCWLPSVRSAIMAAMVVEPDDLGRVELDGEELPAARLHGELEFAPEDAGLAAALARHVAVEYDDEDIPATWLVLVEEPTRVVVGGVVRDWEEEPSGDSSEGPWTVVELVLEESSWSVRTDSLGVHPHPTRRAKGRGLRLEWPAGVIEHPSGCIPPLYLQLRNESTDAWEDRDGKDLVASVRLVGPEGKSIPAGPTTTRIIMLLGDERRHHHQLPPGGVLVVPAQVPTHALEHLPCGRYGLEAALKCYELTASAIESRGVVGLLTCFSMWFRWRA